MILGTTNKPEHYRGFTIIECLFGFRINGCPSAGSFITAYSAKRYIDENLLACPRDAGG